MRFIDSVCGHGWQAKICDTSVETFTAFLEYLYSDHAPVEDVDSVGLLQLADRYCVPRLVNLCELYIPKEVDRSVSKNIEKSDIDVIGLLHISQVHFTLFALQLLDEIAIEWVVLVILEALIV